MEKIMDISKNNEWMMPFLPYLLILSIIIILIGLYLQNILYVGVGLIILCLTLFGKKRKTNLKLFGQELNFED
jgi:Flp pilus assembly protein TadB